MNIQKFAALNQSLGQVISFARSDEDEDDGTIGGAVKTGLGVVGAGSLGYAGARAYGAVKDHQADLGAASAGVGAKPGFMESLESLASNKGANLVNDFKDNRSIGGVGVFGAAKDAVTTSGVGADMSAGIQKLGNMSGSNVKRAGGYAGKVAKSAGQGFREAQGVAGKFGKAAEYAGRAIQKVRFTSLQSRLIALKSSASEIRFETPNGDFNREHKRILNERYDDLKKAKSRLEEARFYKTPSHDAMIEKLQKESFIGRGAAIGAGSGALAGLAAGIKDSKNYRTKIVKVGNAALITGLGSAIAGGVGGEIGGHIRRNSEKK